MKLLFTDTETRSRIDLKQSGQRRYALDPSTQITVATWQMLEVDAGVRSWHPRIAACFVNGFEALARGTAADYQRDIQEADYVVAHNANFDVNVIEHQFPAVKIPVQKVIDTMACAQRMLLPGGLDEVAKTLGGLGKLQDGKALVMATCKPQQNGYFLGDFQSPQEADIFRRLITYCLRDLDQLIFVFDKLPMLPPEERKIFERTWRKNSIGLPIDLKLAQAVASRRDQIEQEIAAELKELTQGAVTSITQRKRILDWVRSKDFPIENTKKATIEEILDDAGNNMPPEIIRVLQIVKEDGGSAPSKAQALLNRSVNGYYLDATRYFATRSGRGTSEGVNMFNIARPSGKHDIEQVTQRALAGDVTLTNTQLTDILRGMICAPPGWKIVDVDEMQGELRVQLWLTGDQERLNMLAAGDDLYAFNGAQFFGIPNLTKKTHPLERQLAKQGTLGCGYGCGGERFTATVRLDTQVPLDVRRSFTVERGTSIVWAYRNSNPLLCNRTNGLWAQLDEAAKNALKYPGVWFNVARDTVGFCMGSDATLWLRLPSGRMMPHYNAHIDAWGDFRFRRARHGIMMSQKSYGGAWFEIICQSTLRDIVTGVEEQVEREIPFAPIILDVYDSLVMLAPEREAEAVRDHVISIMHRPIPWAPGLPVGGEGYCDQRMRK